MRGRERWRRRERRWVACSVALYRALLWAYPAPFRREWCRDMIQLFGDCCRDGYRVGGVGGLARVWLVALADLARSVPRERLERLRRPRRRWHNPYTRLALQALAAERDTPRPAPSARREALAPHLHLRWLKHLLRRRGRRPAPRFGGGQRTMQEQFEKFTERARRTLVNAQEEAQRFHHNYIGTEHLLLGLLHDPDSLAAKVLIDMGVERERVRSAVEHIIGRGDRIVLGDIGLTPRSKKVIELAITEARSLNHHYIGTEHLLLALVREGEGIAAGVLASQGVTLDRARANVILRLREA